MRAINVVSSSSPDLLAQSARQPLIWPVERRVGIFNAQLFLGNDAAAEDAKLLGTHQITSALSLSMDVPLSELILPDGISLRRSQIGLIDGAGNTAPHLMAAVLAVSGLLAQSSPLIGAYAVHRPGNLLVHCRDGIGPSIVVLALYLHLAQDERYPTFKSALDRLRAARGLGQELPCGPLWQLAVRCLNREAVSWLKAALRT